MVGPVNGT